MTATAARLFEGWKYRDHADAGDRERGLRSQPFLQEQLSVQAADGCRRDSRLSGFRQELHGAMRGTSWSASGGADARCCACLDVAWNRSLSRQEESRSSHRRKARWRAPPARGKCIQRPVANRSGGAGQEPGNAELGTTPQVAWAATGKSVVLSREGGAAPAALAARGAPDRAPHRAVFLSAEPDQDHERGHRDLRALPDREPAARTGADFRRQFP